MPLSTDTNFNVGEARQHAARDEVDALQAVLQEHLGRRVRVRGRGAVARRCARVRTTTFMSPLPMWKCIGSPASCAIAHSGSQCVFAEVRQPEALRLTGEEDAAVTGVEVARRSPSTVGVDVPERRGHDREQPAVVGRRPVAEEVVVRAARTRASARRRGSTRKRWLPNAGDVRVEHLRPDPDLVHVLRAGRRRRTPRGWHSS